MKKTIVFTLLLTALSFATYAQKPLPENKAIERANIFIERLVKNVPDLTEDEKTKFFEFKKAQVIDLHRVQMEYKDKPEYDEKFKEVLTSFQKAVKDEFGIKRGSELIKASLTE